MARELQVRAWAGALTAAEAELADALASEAWLRRATALQALRRGLPVASEAEAATTALGVRTLVLARATDARGPDRAQALAALAVWPEPVALDELALASALEAAPAVTLALARVLERDPRGDAAAWLARLARHPDERVRTAAREGLSVRADGVPHLAALLREVHPIEQRAEHLDLLERLERARADEASLAAALPDELDPAAGREGRAAVEAVRMIVHGRGDVRALAAGWVAEGAGALRRSELMLRAARVARERDLALCVALLEGAASDGRHAEALLEGAASAAAPHEVVRLAADLEGLDAARRALVWGWLVGRATSWDEASVGPWLDPGRDATVRAAVLDAVAAAFRETADPGSGRLLARALADADDELATTAFRALAGAADPRPWLPALHAAWAGLDARERVERLRWLPRGLDPGPFEPDLRALGERELEARGACAELLAGRRGDRATRALLERWLGEELARLDAGPEADLAAEQRAVALLRALRACDLAGASAALLEAAARSAPRSIPVAKTALGALGELDAAADRLAGWLEAGRPSRLRVEAALALAARGSAPAVDVLAERYAGCDADLRARSLRALRGRRDRPSLELLRGVAGDAAERSELRRTAIEALAVAGQREDLERLLEGSRDLEVRDAAIGALATVGGASACASLAARFEALEGASRPSLDDEARAAERESLLRALATCEAWPPSLAAGWLARPLAAREDDLRARLAGERLPPAAFRFAGELALARALAARGALRDELERVAGWRALDGRLLGRLALEAADLEPAAASALLDAALVALLGEDEGEDGPQVRLELRVARVASAEAGREWARMARELESLLADWRALRLPERTFEQAFGRLDPARGVDPRSRLESAAWQARAWQALDEGQPDDARELAGGARARLGASRDAARAQARLEAALGDR